MKRTLTIAFFAALLLATPARALLIAGDYAISFDGTLVRDDSSTGLVSIFAFNGAGSLTVQPDGEVTGFSASIIGFNFVEDDTVPIVRSGDGLVGRMLQLSLSPFDLAMLDLEAAGTFSGAWGSPPVLSSASGVYALTLTSSVTEPAALALFALGLAGVGAVRRRPAP